MDEEPIEEGLVKPRLLRGFRDLLPHELIARERMISIIRRVFESHGFVPLATPALEPLDVLGKSDLEDESGTGGGSIFQVLDPDNPGERVGLRYDLTVPLARVVSQYESLGQPFRRYQCGSVWRVDKPAPGRFREFLQFDIDVVGSAQMEADAEIVACMVETLEALEIPRFVVRINNRKILQGLLDLAAVPAGLRRVKVGKKELSIDVRQETLRSLDKLDRLGLEGVMELLDVGRMDETGDFKPGVQLEEESRRRLRQYLEIPAVDRKGTLAALRTLFAGQVLAEEGIAELATIAATLEALGVAEDKALFDPRIVRGLAYYTGPVFEAILPDAPEFGSVFSGGRYDGLVRRFRGTEIPAVGASVGVDRLLVVLKHLGLVEERASTADVLITVMDGSRQTEYMRMAAELRRAGVPAEVFTGSGGFRKQLKYADRRGVPIAIIAGEDEFQANTVSIKDLWSGAVLARQIDKYEEWRKNPTQVTVPRGEMVATIRAMLERQGEMARQLREDRP